MPKKDTNHYMVTDPDGNEYEISDLTKFCKEHGLWPGNMRKVARGQAKHSKRWKCRYTVKEQVKKREVLDTKKLSKIDKVDKRKISEETKTEAVDPPLNDYTDQELMVTDSEPTQLFERKKTNEYRLIDGAKKSEKEGNNLSDILVSEEARKIWEKSKKIKYKFLKLLGVEDRLIIEQGEFTDQGSLESLKEKGYTNFLKIRKGLVLTKEDYLTQKTYFILFDLTESMPIDLEPIITAPGGKVFHNKKIALLAKLYCYAMSNDLIIDKNEKAGIVTIINGFNYEKSEVYSAKTVAMHIAIMEMLSDNLIAKDEQALINAFRYSLDIKKEDDLLMKESSVMAKVAKLYYNKEYNEVKLNKLRKTAEKLGCLTLDVEELIDKVALEWFAKQCLEGKLPIINININLKKNEEAYLAVPVKVLQQKTETKTIRGYVGTRIKIKKLPIPIYLGGSIPKKIEKEVIKEVGTGTLCVTNNRVILSGTKTNYSIWFDKILQVVMYSDAIQINYEGRYGGRFYVIDESKMCGVMINSLISRKAR